MAKPNALTPEQLEFVRGIFRELYEQHKSQPKLEQLTGVGQRTISKILRGEPFGLHVVQTLATNTGALDMGEFWSGQLVRRDRVAATPCDGHVSMNLVEGPLHDQWFELLEQAAGMRDATDPSQTRAFACAVARMLGCRDQALAEVRREPVPDPDLTITAWLVRIRVTGEELTRVGFGQGSGGSRGSTEPVRAARPGKRWT